MINATIEKQRLELLVNTTLRFLKDQGLNPFEALMVLTCTAETLASILQVKEVGRNEVQGGDS